MLGRQPHRHIRHGQASRRFFGPFDHDQAGRVQQFIEARVQPLTGIGKSIQIKVMRGIVASNSIGLNQRICRTFYAPRNASCTQQAADQGGFAGAKVAMQKHEQPWPHALGQTGSKRKRSRLIRQYNLP